eukprot:TRINITY_DN41628_c0_g1_i1.p1 TRINITY_DN41628_c0_g1~~TRINITY_DN41628_c0_g1_i1.p1  ORF type:complete len:546 (+),score=99.61 TRINITY_DN41628_c0_g1_i1:108-1745(+)
MRLRQVLQRFLQVNGVLLGVLLLRRILRWLQRYRATSAIRASSAPEYLRWSACDLAAAMRRGSLRSTEVVDACIAVLQATSKLNALATERFAQAREDASRADKLLADRASSAEALPPFLGVPIILKEAYEYPALPYTMGLVRRQECLGERKGPVVRRVEEAGFVVLAFGNISEATMWMESYNCVYGRSSSPFDLSRTPGGSSGGTAAAVAVLGSPIGVTSDIGGSTRIPAFCCGLFGHKPTGGLAPNTGTHLENFHGAICRICQPGMVSRHAEDLLPFLQLISGPPTPEEDSLAAEYLPRAPTWGKGAVDFKRLRVVPLRFRGGRPRTVKELPGLLISSITPELEEGQRRVAEWLGRQGCQVQPMCFEDLAVGEWFATWADRNQSAGGPTFREVLCQGRTTFGIGELFRYALGWSGHTLPALGLAFLEDLVECFSPPQSERLKNAAAVEALLEAALGEYGVFVMPTLPRHAPKHDELLFRFLDSSFTCIWNAVEFPSTAVPLGSTAQGLPLGVQIISTRGRDELTISIAVELAKAGVASCATPGF